MYETQVPSLGWEDPLEESMATHSSVLAWRTHGLRSLVGCRPQGHKEPDAPEAIEQAGMYCNLHNSVCLPCLRDQGPNNSALPSGTETTKEAELLSKLLTKAEENGEEFLS